jgi:hypothetical protein
MKNLSFWKKSVYSGLVFFGTVIVLTVGYALFNNPLSMSTVGSGSGLTANGWNALVNNINDLNTRLSNISFSGVNVGIGTTNPGALLDLAGTQNTTGNQLILRIPESNRTTGVDSLRVYNSPQGPNYNTGDD